MKIGIVIIVLIIGCNAYQALHDAVDATPSQIAYLQSTGALK